MLSRINVVPSRVPLFHPVLLLPLAILLLLFSHLRCLFKNSGLSLQGVHLVLVRLLALLAVQGAEMLVVHNTHDLVEHGIVCLLYCLLIGPYILSIVFKPGSSQICGILHSMLSPRESTLFILSLLPGNLLLFCHYKISLIYFGFAELLSLSHLSSLALHLIAITLYFLLSLLSIVKSLLLSNLSLLFLTLLLFSISLLSPDVLDRRQKYLLQHNLIVLHCGQLFATADATP